MNSTRSNDRFASFAAQARRGEIQDAFATLRSAIDPNDSFVTLRKYLKVFDTMDRDALGLKPIRIAILSSATVDHVSEMVRLWLACEGFAAQFYIAPFDTVVSTILDKDGDLYAFQPEIVWIFTTGRDLRIDMPPGSAVDVVDEAVAAEVDMAEGLWAELRKNCPALVIQNNADTPSIDVLGNFEGSVGWSRRSVIRKFNSRLADRASGGVVIFDYDHLSALYGQSRWFEYRHWHHSKQPMTFDAMGLVGFTFARLVAAIKGQAKKCVVLDLDNTLWGGVIGDDGLAGIKLGNGATGEAFSQIQDYFKSLKQRGVILAVCSKNEAANAREPFEQHPDMRLKLDDIAEFVANWNNKADNIRTIAENLNIGLDSMVFIDDNPVERDVVRQYLPMVAVPELSDDPAEYVGLVHRLRYFETAAYSQEDAVRTEYYRANAQRRELQGSFADQAQFQESLLMEAEIGCADGMYLARSAQLINKSNQFHLTGTRYSEAEVSAFQRDENWICRHFILRDRFGDNGLISVVLMRQDGPALVVDTWVMSCRVLGRAMEEFIANEIARVALDRGCEVIRGRYVPSKKNKLVAQLYQRLRFEKVGEVDGVTDWIRPVNPPVLLDTKIKLVGSEPAPRDETVDAA
ncbi:HAD-IIIC family phosphatase [Bradyrhizobium sp. HKCCYLRH2060]|uniref:HAD-IIIC family phosphatase n=1 Tax=Bradyrhizobium TaxID=374 RepID=UPI002916E725|nr:HAD-IIIC family phosphatase [Bradyrhizobium sp. SZCCHNR3003]